MVALALVIGGTVPARRSTPARPGLEVGHTSPTFRFPTGIAVDRTGAVYVASAGDSSIVVFPPGASGPAMPVRRMGPEGGLVSPEGIALDSHGSLYIASGSHRNEGKGSITLYAPGASGDVAPIRVIAGPATALNQPTAVALSTKRKLYVVNGPVSGAISVNGVVTGLASEVLVFGSQARGDAAPEQRLVDVSDTLLTTSIDSNVTAPNRLIDTTCGKSKISIGSAICVTSPHNNPEVEPGLTLRQHSDTGRPLDVTTGIDGGILVLTSSGVTEYGQTGIRHRLLPLGAATAEGPFFRWTRGPSRLAEGPDGQLYLAGRTPSTMSQGFFKSKPDSDSSGRKSPVSGPRKPNMPASKPGLGSWLGSVIGEPFISVYSSMSNSDTIPVRTISGPHTGLGGIACLRVGSDGSLYVLESPSPMSGGMRVAIFPPDANGDVQPVRVIQGPRTEIRGSTSLAIDRDGRIYVANNRINEDPVFGAATITVYAADAIGDAAPIRTISGWSTRLSRPSGIAVADDGTIYMANSDVYGDDHGSVRIYPAKASANEAPTRTLIGRETGFARPQGMALDRADTLYVISRQLARITVYTPEASGRATPVRTIEGPATELRGSRSFPYDPEMASQLTIDAAGYLYVADPVQASGLNAYGPDLGAVRVYRPGAFGNEAPVRRIIGGYTKLNGPGGMAIDRRGNLYVPNRWGTGPGSVTVYGPKTDGDVHPVRMIAGPATGLQQPAAVALGPRDTLYVLNAASVTVYAPGARGNATPLRTINAQ